MIINNIREAIHAAMLKHINAAGGIDYLKPSEIKDIANISRLLSTQEHPLMLLEDLRRYSRTMKHQVYDFIPFVANTSLRSAMIAVLNRSIFKKDLVQQQLFVELQTELIQLRHQKPDLAEHNRRIEHLEEQLLESNRRERELSDHNRILKTLTQQLTEEKQAIANPNKPAPDSLITRLEMLEAKMAKQESSMRKLQVYNAQLRQKVLQLTEENEDLREEKLAATAELELLRRQCQQHLQEIDTLKSQLHNLRGSEGNSPDLFNTNGLQL